MKAKTPTPKVGSAGDPQQTSLKARFGSNGSDRRPKQFEWSDANPVLLAEAIAKCTRGGDAVMFGRTRDGGAGALTVLSGDERQRFYPSDSASVDNALMQVAYAYSTADEKRQFPNTFSPIGGK